MKNLKHFSAEFYDARLAVSEDRLAVYTAALTGFVANKDFHGPIFQGSAVAAHEFAMRAVEVAFGETTQDTTHDH